jgi:hypothetical protein
MVTGTNVYLGRNLTYGIFRIMLITLSPTAPCTPLYLTALGLICPNKNRADLPEGRELRTTVIAALLIGPRAVSERVNTAD